MISHSNPASEPGHNFTSVPAASIERSSMDRSHSLDLTHDGGYLIPILVDDMLPGDTINLNVEKLVRLNTPILPLMHNVFVDTHVWFVPNRLIWSNWQKFMGEQINPGDSINFVTPKLNRTTVVALNSLEDYLGMPTGFAFGTARGVNVFDWRTYNCIWNNWYRDENLQNSVANNLGDGPDAEGDYTLLKRGKRKDVFTGALPFAQKGTAVTIPLGTTAPVNIPITPLVRFGGAGTGTALFDSVSGGAAYADLEMDPAGIGAGYLGGFPIFPNPPFPAANGPRAVTLKFGDNVNPVGTADLSGATAATVNLFRQSFAIQQLLERDARGGTRYPELLHSHFGVTSPDARLQRPEFLGGGSDSLMIHTVAQTAPAAGGSTPLGNLAAFGTCTGGHSIVHSFVEHGILMVLMSVRAELKYFQGIERRKSRSTRYDYFWPSFAHLGEQAILNQEIYYQNNGATSDTLVFGYNERYYEYRYAQSRLAGLMRPGVAGTLAAYNLAQQFVALPVLDTSFVQVSDPWTRVEAVTTEPTFRSNIHFNYKHVRPMPLFGTPGLRMM